MTSTRDIWVTSFDGLRLYASDTAAQDDEGLVPVLCLPGLTRNSKDFGPALAQLSTKHRVICMDFRGRGRSQYAADPATYTVEVEARDVIALLDQLALQQVAIVGTSRGGIVGMALAVYAADRVSGLLLNDIGPTLEVDGLLRIRSYLGVEPRDKDFAGAAERLARTSEGVEGLSKAQWLAHAHRLFRDEGGVPKLDYDPLLAATFPTDEQLRTKPGPELWNLFHKLPDIPLALLHGANSHLLSSSTVAAMQQAKPSLAVTTVTDRAHVPFLDEP